MNKIQQRYLDARQRFWALLEKKHQTEDALGILIKDWSKLTADELQHEIDLDANLEGFFGLDLARAELREATHALIDWGLDQAFSSPQAEPFYPMLRVFQKERNNGMMTFGRRIQSDVIDLILKLDTDQFPTPKRS